MIMSIKLSKPGSDSLSLVPIDAPEYVPYICTSILGMGRVKKYLTRMESNNFFYYLDRINTSLKNF